MSDVIPVIDARRLAAPTQDADLAADLSYAARGAGFLRLGHVDEALGLPSDIRQRLLGFFALDEAEKNRLARRKFAPEHANVYRGYFPLQLGQATYKEGIDIGADAVDPDRVGAPSTVPGAAPGDPLLEPTPWPDAAPEWREDVAAYYAAMERLGGRILTGLAHGLGVAPALMTPLFENSNSTLRMIRYPERPASSLPEDLDLVRVAQEPSQDDSQLEKRWIIGAPHTDSGFVTLLWQDPVGGLQAETADGRWIDVPPVADGLAVNFGELLEQWTGGKVRATRHRVIGGLQERASIPFFYEPAVDAVIEPLPLADSEQFAPFAYGDFLWSHMATFVEFRGIERAA